MKMDRDRIEGQLDIFEAMNRAAAAVDQMVESGKTGSGKKTTDKKLKSGKNSREKISQTLENTDTEGKEDYIKGCDMHAAMQKTFLNPQDGDFAMVAYIDYHMVYVRDWNAPAHLKKFENSKDAVEYYAEQLEHIRMQEGAEVTEEHEPFVNVKYTSENLYMEWD